MDEETKRQIFKLREETLSLVGCIVQVNEVLSNVVLHPRMSREESLDGLAELTRRIDVALEKIKAGLNE